MSISLFGNCWTGSQRLLSQCSEMPLTLLARPPFASYLHPHSIKRATEPSNRLTLHLYYLCIAI